MHFHFQLSKLAQGEVGAHRKMWIFLRDKKSVSWMPTEWVEEWVVASPEWLRLGECFMRHLARLHACYAQLLLLLLLHAAYELYIVCLSNKPFQTAKLIQFMTMHNFLARFNLNNKTSNICSEIKLMLLLANELSLSLWHFAMRLGPRTYSGAALWLPLIASRTRLSSQLRTYSLWAHSVPVRIALHSLCIHAFIHSFVRSFVRLWRTANWRLLTEQMAFPPG